eukprot:CAMPEP_0168179854 /NCGR_PEP_ID=MMETSP0139_2-20121125/10116_1 /TAXON_ID=44445 /ORGANISM="Pseudo-nitzschia australis, Strain 10249 10 AB" /LENGTH=563 /DNA_ID=CAMNT_0008099813 /DNA_START=217 /DNA_END=1909 /DNA_ORIENTATION=-
MISSINTNTNTNTNNHHPAATAAAVGAVRNLNLHEFSSMELLRKHGIRTPRGYPASNTEEAEDLFRRHFQKNKPSAPHTNSGNNDDDDDGQEVFRDAVLKAQVLSGARNSGTFGNGFVGGVHVVSDPGRAREVAERMLSGAETRHPAGSKRSRLQQGLAGGTIQAQARVLSLHYRGSVQPGAAPDGSPFGGSSDSIVEIARSHPGLIFTEEIDIADGLEIDQCQRMAENIGLDPGDNKATFDQAVDTMMKLYRLFEKCDCTQIEVNPLAEVVAENADGKDNDKNSNNNNNDNNNDETTTLILAVDDKIQFDDNAAFQQEAIFAQRDYDQEDPREAEAIRHGIDYIGLDGSIGCMVNGAGLAMATMDLIHAKGGSPSNFLDVGGGASEKQVQKAFEILEKDPRVKVILVNIFGGLMRCDVIADGLLKAAETIGIQTTPLVIRLQGTNYQEAKKLIAESGLRDIISVASNLDDAVTQAVQIAAKTKAVEIETTSCAATLEHEHEHSIGQENGDDDDDIKNNINTENDFLFDDLYLDDPLEISSEIPDDESTVERVRIPKFEGFSI